MTESDRTFLYTQMGWGSCGETMGQPPGERYFEELPDPFTDANADYAVLEWVRTKQIDQSGFALELERILTQEMDCYDMPEMKYQIGDYARAALSVLRAE